MLSRALKISTLLLLLVWPWQTQYFLWQGPNEYLSTSLYLSDLLILAIVALLLFGARLNIKLSEILRYFFLGLAPVAILAVAQFSLQTTWPTKWLGLAEHDPSVLGQVVIETASGERWLRAYGSFAHPNILGGVMAAAILLVLIANKKTAKMTDNFYLVIFSSALFFSFSRAAWMALAVAMAVYSFRRFDGWQTKLKKIATIFLVFVVLSVTYSDLLLTRTLASGRLESKSINERVSYYAEAGDLFKTTPYFGVGFHNYIPSLQRMKPNQPVWSYQPVHNTFVLILVEIGLIGVALLAVLLYLIFRYKIKNTRCMMGVEILALLSLIITLGMLDHWLWSLHSGLIFSGFIVGIGIKLLKENNIIYE